MASRVPNKSIVLKRNPYYKGKRPHNADQIIYTIGNSLDATYLRVQQGATDYAAGGIPPASYAEAAQKYGINKGQFWVKPLLLDRRTSRSTRPAASSRTTSRCGRPSTRRSTARRCSRSRASWPASAPTRSCLPAWPGSATRICTRSRQPNLKAAQKLAQGHTGDGNVVLYEGNRGASPLRAQIIQFNLKQIGLNVDVQLFPRAVQIEKEGTRGEPFDIADESWGADYADPYDFINVLLDGNNIQNSNNNNFAYFNDPKFNQQMTQASLLTGDARLQRVRQPRRGDHAAGGAVGAALEREQPDARQQAVRLLHVQRDLHGRSRGGLPQVGATRGRGASAPRPLLPRRFLPPMC